MMTSKARTHTNAWNAIPTVVIGLWIAIPLACVGEWVGASFMFGFAAIGGAFHAFVLRR